jgi:hypothetical protein
MSLKRRVRGAQGRRVELTKKTVKNNILPIHYIRKYFLNLNHPQLRCFIGAIKDSTKTIQYLIAGVNIK